MAKAPAPETADARILNIAIEHIRRFGLRKTTVVGIAEEAQMSHANVYRHFPSKQALIEAVTVHWLKPLEAGLRDIADGPDPAHDKLERMIMALWRAYRDQLEREPALFELFAEATRAGRPLARRHRTLVQGYIQRTLEDGAGGDTQAGGGHRRATTLIFDSLHRFIHPLAVAGDRETPRAQMDARLERLSRVIFAALQRGRV